jgi:hypothetical protein
VTAVKVRILKFLGLVHYADDDSDEQMNLKDAVIGLKAYKEVEERMEQLWHNLDAAIVSPRLQTDAPSLPSITAEPVSCTAYLLNCSVLICHRMRCVFPGLPIQVLSLSSRIWRLFSLFSLKSCLPISWVFCAQS